MKLRKVMTILQIVAGAGIVTLSVLVAFSGYFWFRDLSVLYPTSNISLGWDGFVFLQSESLLYIVATATGFILLFQPLVDRLALNSKEKSEAKK